MLNAEEAVRRITRLACKFQEEGLPLSPLLVLGVIEGRVNVEEKAAPLPHDLPRHDVGSSPV